jgi:hypothetical protein
MPRENIKHPGSVGACQLSETGIAWIMARVVASATCSSAEFFDLPAITSYSVQLEDFLVSDCDGCKIKK